MTENPRIVILTALDVEHEEVRARLGGVRTRVHPAGTRFCVGRAGAGGPLVALTLTGKGNLPAGTLTERAITYFSPVAVIFVGIAGARRSDIRLGDVVVATHVYAYHGATVEDEGTWARPRVWDTAHGVDQAARQVARDRAWTRLLPAGRPAPRVHFGPVAAGEQVHYSRTSPDARWLHEHYNDAAAVETESAGAAQASYLNDALPMAVVRGISDPADHTKERADRAGWQQRAAASAAAFALALAGELAASLPRRPGAPAGGGREHPAGSGQGPQQQGSVTHVTNTASGGAHVGVQAGQIFGGVHNGAGEAAGNSDVLTLLADLRSHLEQARREGRIEAEIGQAAVEEAGEAYDAARQRQHGRLKVALRRLCGLIGDLTEFAAKLTAIMTAVRGMA
jgi:adenosylhomocysteine nucleosidase